MKSGVTLNKDGIVEIIIYGDLNAATVIECGNQATELLQNLGKQGKPQLLLCNIIHLGLSDISARQKVAEFAHAMPFTRAGLVGDGSVYMRISTNLLLHGIGKRNIAHYFEDRDQAIAWLLSAAK